jgi:hypothetical protein
MFESSQSGELHAAGHKETKMFKSSKMIAVLVGGVALAAALVPASAGVFVTPGTHVVIAPSMHVGPPTQGVNPSTHDRPHSVGIATMTKADASAFKKK